MSSEAKYAAYVARINRLERDRQYAIDEIYKSTMLIDKLMDSLKKKVGVPAEKTKADEFEWDQIEFQCSYIREIIK